MIDLGPEDFPPFAVFHEKMGFIPSFFRAQTLRTDLIESQARALQAVLLTRDVLPRFYKEYIFLVISAANLNTYCVANHCGLLRGMGIPEDQSDQIAFNHRDAGLAPHEVALLDFVLRLTQRPAEFSGVDIDALRRHGFSEEQILEAVVLSGFVDFINMLNVGLGVLPDFKPRHVFKPEHLHAKDDLKKLGEISLTEMNLSTATASLMDEDARLVARVRDGDVEAFEDLVRRHHGRVYRTLVGITGNADEAQDFTQNVFLKAFKNIGKFEGTAKFSTWLIRIAINEGIERVRSQRPFESLDDDARIDGEDYRPRQVQAWVDDPEQLYSHKEMREIVEKEMMKLPSKYRVAVILRDIELLSNQEAAASMNLGLEAFKSRLLRGRLALREALAPQFRIKREGVARV
jgi:RNA polymerase sigma-70 factor (ECF subfamily)